MVHIERALIQRSPAPHAVLGRDDALVQTRIADRPRHDVTIEASDKNRKSLEDLSHCIADQIAVGRIPKGHNTRYADRPTRVRQRVTACDRVMAQITNQFRPLLFDLHVHAEAYVKPYTHGGRRPSI